MRPRNRVSSVGLELVKRFEGYRRQAAQLPDGRWTIGYGHTLTAREGAQVSEQDAESLLIYDLNGASKTVSELVFTPLNQNQFDALCSFAFNLGPDEFRRSDVLKRLNEGGMVQAACAMEMWRKAEFEGEEIVVDALVRRRAAEKILFLTPVGDAFVPAPSAVLRPRIDVGADDLVPADTPTQLATSLYGASVVVTRGAAPPPEPTPEPSPPPEPPPPPPPPPSPPEPEPVIEPAFDLPPEPAVDRVTAAAEAVTARLETLFADPADYGAEPAALAEPETEPEPAPEPEAEPEPEPEPPRERDEAAFIEAFIEAGPDPEATDPQPAEPVPSEPAQRITPFVVSYPAVAAPGPSTFQSSFEGPSGFATVGPPPSEVSDEAEEPEPVAAHPEPEPDPDPEPEVVAEPIDEDEDGPPLSFEAPDADLWGDDEPYVAPAIDAEPEPAVEAEDFELSPTAQVPSPPRAPDEDDRDAFTRRPQFEAPETPEPHRERPPLAADSPPVRDFIPHRPPPRVERPREPGLLTDLFLALLGIAFFGFAVFWALNAKVDPASSGVHPSLIAWPTGFIGIGFVVVAIFRLLERLGDAAERD